MPTNAETLRGRDPELAAIGEQLNRIRLGSGSTVLLKGGAGMGKSRLLDEAAGMARRLGYRIGRGAAQIGEGAVELSTLLHALTDGAQPLVARHALRDVTAEAQQRYWVLEDLQALLEQAAESGPLLICLDDLQWADGGTAAALRALPDRLSRLPIGWVLAFRPGEGSEQLVGVAQSLERNGAIALALGPLEEAAVVEMVVDAIRAQPDRAILEMAAGAQGSPFQLNELLAGLLEERLVRVEAGQATLVEPRLPRRVRDTMRERLERMTPPARRAATVAATLGQRFSLLQLATALDVAPPSLIDPVDELIAADLLVESADKLAFRHDLTRDAVRASLPASTVHALDRHAAAVLLAAGALPVEVAMQMASSAEPGDELAVTTLFKAAETLGATAPGPAADLARRALELAPGQHPLRGALVAQTAVLLHAAGRSSEAMVFADTSLRRALTPEQEAEVRLSVTGLFTVSADIRADSGRKALALDGLPLRLRARHEARLIHNLLVAGRTQESRERLPQAREVVRASQDGDASFALILAEGALQHEDAQLDQSLVTFNDAVRAGVEAHEPARESLALQWRCVAMAALDRFDEGMGLAAESIIGAQRDRQAWVLHLFEMWRGRQMLHLGRLADATAALGGRFDVDAAGVLDGLDAAGAIALGRVALHVGDARQLRETQILATRMASGGTPAVRRYGAWLLALQAMAEGDPSRAHAHLCSLGERERTTILPHLAGDATDEVHLVRIAVAARDEQLAQTTAARVERRRERNPDVRSIKAVAAHVRGLADDSKPHLVAAVELFDNGPRPLAAASAHEDLARSHLRDGQRAEGIGSLDRALTLYAGAGAIWDAGRIRGRLRRLGIRRRLASSDRPTAGWGAMTESEVAVARLVADGMTNREVAEQLFVSPHTVNSHLRHVFAKLDVSSRVQLSQRVRESEPG